MSSALILQLNISCLLTYYFKKQMDLTYQQIMQMFTARRERPIEKLMSIPIIKCPSIEDASKNMNEALIPLYNALFTKEEEMKEVNLKAFLPYDEIKTAMPVCNKLLTINQPVYRCYDCTTHEAAVLCMTCFERGNHQGHRFSKIQSGGGNCDCGNPDAILESGFCVDHKGKAQEFIIDEKAEQWFDLEMRQIFIWVLRLSRVQLKKESEILLTHLIDFLNGLNTQSLYYNTLTSRMLFKGENQIIDHILIIGAMSRDSPLAKKATELFLKMFSLEEFKQNMAALYLRAYNRLPKFQDSRFESLFIQLFANNDLVEKVVQKHGISLDPRQRQYNANSYYGSLIFMGSIKQKAARAFFTPIIQKGGIHTRYIEDLQEECEFGSHKIEEFYGENINVQNLYYSTNKVLLRLIKTSPELLEKQLLNNYQLINKYTFNNNKVVLIYQRIFAMTVFVYFNCDYEKIDVERLCDVLKISLAKMREFLLKLTKCFFFCLKELGRCIGNSGFGRHGFQNYVDLYCRSYNGNKVILLDVIGLKFCAMAFEKMKEVPRFCKVFTDMFNQESHKEMLLCTHVQGYSSEEEQQSAPKSKPTSVIFYLGWLNAISLIIENILYDRAEISLATQLEITDHPLVTEMYEHQFKKLLLNIREISVHEVEAMGGFWFNKSINKAIINKYATFDKYKKKYVMKEDVTGIPVKRELLKSFAKTPDHYLRASDQMAMEITDRIRRWRELFFTSTFMTKIYKGLLTHLNSTLKKEFPKYLKELATHLKIMNILFEYDNVTLQEVIDVVTTLAEEDQKLKSEIDQLFQTDKNERMIEQECDKQKNDKRKELLKKKKQEKLKMLKSKINVEKFLIQNEHEDHNNKVGQNEPCIICHQHSSEYPLYYMASTYLSNIVYSILKVQGINPYFISCFHQVHQKCYLSVSAEKERITCPLCKSYINIIIPTEISVSNSEVLTTSVERIQVMLAIEYKKEYSNIYIEIMKSFIQLFFSGTIEQGIVNQRQIKLYRILFEMVKAYYTGLDEENKDLFTKELNNFSQNYEKSSKTLYNFGLLIDLVFKVSIRVLNNAEVTQQFLKEIVNHCIQLPRNDLIKCLGLVNKLFNLQCQSSTLLTENQIQEEGKQLKSFIYTFDPPKSIRSLLEQRKQIEGENICKMGHNICICLICSWKGCLDCGTCSIHTKEVHNNDTLYFNFITGGFHHQYNRVIINIRSLYVNDLGISWKARFEDDAYFFEIDIYQKMIQALKCGNLIQMIRNNFENLRSGEGNWN